jgi:hypothetical protein
LLLWLWASAAGLVVDDTHEAAIAREVKPIDVAGDCEAGAGDLDALRRIPRQTPVFRGGFGRESERGLGPASLAGHRIILRASQRSQCHVARPALRVAPSDAGRHWRSGLPPLCYCDDRRVDRRLEARQPGAGEPAVPFEPLNRLAQDLVHQIAEGERIERDRLFGFVGPAPAQRVFPHEARSSTRNELADCVRANALAMLGWPTPTSPSCGVSARRYQSRQQVSPDRPIRLPANSAGRASSRSASLAACSGMRPRAR